MAEKGAHLSRHAVQLKPTLFDYASQHSLDSILYPALKRVADVLAARSVTPFPLLSKCFDEMYYAAHLLLQMHYLRKFSATFSERFYALKRVSATCPESGLTKHEILISLLFSSVLPYIRHKLNKFAEKIYFEMLPFEKSRRKRMLLKSVVEVNRASNIAYHVISFVYYLRYIAGKSDFVSPSLAVAGVKLEFAPDALPDNPLTFSNFISQGPRRSLEVVAFFVQFCHWWDSERMGASASRVDAPPPPPPQVREQGVQYAGICPICGGKRNSETVLSTSGFVFCFKCISDYVGTHNRCPVTDLPATVNTLVRLYASE